MTISNISYDGQSTLISAQGGSGPSATPSKFEENGKKFGKKLGNAAIFGAGATCKKIFLFPFLSILAPAVRSIFVENIPTPYPPLHSVS